MESNHSETRQMNFNFNTPETEPKKPDYSDSKIVDINGYRTRKRDSIPEREIIERILKKSAHLFEE